MSVPNSMRRAPLCGLLLAAGLVTVAPAIDQAGAAAGLRRGIYDVRSYQGLGSDSRRVALAHTRQARASIVRVLVDWSHIAPRQPPDGARARDPGWEGYSFSELDAIVRDVSDAGLDHLLTPLYAPRWAEASHRPKVSRRAPAGSWRPSVSAYRDFSEALARRYSGHFPDPARPGASLPHVHNWQAWNEPNLTNYLAPQWIRRGRGFSAASPGHYRHMLNAFYAAVKAVDRSNFVVSAGTAPFGEPWRGGRRMPPAAFTRAFLCVRGRRHPRPGRCAGSPAHFDALAHHPYALGSPRRHALNPDDVVMPDLQKLSRPMNVAVRSGRALPRAPKQLWVTEFAWDTRPPDPRGTSLGLHAQYIQQGLYTLWRQGVDVAIHFNLRDGVRGQGFKFTYQGGLFRSGGSVALDRPKPGLQAFRFPFAAFRKQHRAKIWGIAPTAGLVDIERRSRGGWKLVTRLRAGGNGVFFGRRRVRKGTALRARMGEDHSVEFRVGPGESL